MGKILFNLSGVNKECVHGIIITKNKVFCTDAGTAQFINKGSKEISKFFVELLKSNTLNKISKNINSISVESEDKTTKIDDNALLIELSIDKNAGIFNVSPTIPNNIDADEFKRMIENFMAYFNQSEILHELDQLSPQKNEIQIQKKKRNIEADKFMVNCFLSGLSAVYCNSEKEYQDFITFMGNNGFILAKNIFPQGYDSFSKFMTINPVMSKRIIGFSENNTSIYKNIDSIIHSDILLASFRNLSGYKQSSSKNE